VVPSNIGPFVLLICPQVVLVHVELEIKDPNTGLPDEEAEIGGR